MKELLKVGNVVDDGTGDYLREGGLKLNNNLNELYGELGDGSVPYPAGAWQTITPLTGLVFNAAFGKSYIVNTTDGKMELKLPKGSSTTYGRTIKIRDTFGIWQKNPVIISPASGDTLKGSSDSKVFNTNLTDLELVYCAPGRWEFLANKLLNKISNGDVATVVKKEFLCTAGQTDFIDIFGEIEYSLVNTHVYHRGNLLFYGTDFSDDSDYGTPGTGNTVVPLDGKSIRLRQAAEEGDSLMVVTYLDGIAQWRSTYNRLDCTILSDKFTNQESLPGSVLVADLDNLKSIKLVDLGYVLNSNSGLVNPSTFEVYLNGVILNESGKGGAPRFLCDGANADNQRDCEVMGGNWVSSNTDYSYTTGDNDAIESIEFDRHFEHGDVITVKWFNNDIGTTMEIDDILDVTDDRYISKGPTYDLNGTVRITDYDNPAWPNVEIIPEQKVDIRVPNDMFDLLYPVGTIYENAVNPNNPSTYMGFGVWQLWGKGRVVVGWNDDISDGDFGLNNNDIDSNGNPTATAGATGGRRSLALTNDDLPATRTDEKVLVSDTNGAIIVGGCQFDPEDTGPAYSKYREERAFTNASHTPPKSVNVLNPYITVYRWMRVA